MDGRGDRRGPVAIIGMACRFPGASDPAEFHDVAVAGRRMFQPVTGLPGRPMYAALVDDWTVPAVSFGDPELGPHDLGPVQKLAAEMTAVALTDAGLRDAAGTARTGLIIASVTPSVCGLVRAEFGFTAGAPYPRAAYQSSLHAVVAAARALQAGELDLAVAGGAELGIDPDWLALQERAGTLGTDEMRVYAADPAGLLPGEGCGIVVLAHTADARAAGVPVYAEIAGWSTWPALAPALAGPASLLAYQQAGIDPADIQFVEGQGTGTSTGDSAELAMLTQLRRGGKAVAALGAVSASIGYTKAAAGIASLVKTASAMAAGTIPPGTWCARPHPLLESGQALLRMPARPEPWPDGTRLAAVNSLGTADPAVMSGFPGARDAEGVHLVLRREGETDRGSGRRRRAAGQPATPPGAFRRPGDVAAQARVFALCGGDLGALAGRLDDIAASATALSDSELPELARQLAIGARRAADHAAPLRVTLTAATPSRLAAQAQYAAWQLRTGGATSGTTEPGVHVTAGAAGAVVVLFPGRAESAAAHQALLTTSLEALGTLDLLGVKPVTGVGYSLGEITGLVWAGSLPAAEAARLVARYGQVLRACGDGRRGSVAMARITADIDLTRALCAPGRLHIAAYEGPRVHVVAGSTTGIRELARRAGPRKVPVEVLSSTTAMHSSAMARCVAPLRSIMAGTRTVPPQRRLISTITGQLVTADDDIAELLARQASVPVLFTQAMTQAAQDADLIVAAGPDAGLAATAAACCGLPAVAIPAPTRAGLAEVTSARTIAALFAAGVIADLLPFLAPAGVAGTLASRTIPRMRLAEPQAPPGRQVRPTAHVPQDLRGQDENGAVGRRTTVRSARS
jgi:enediyne polyketide synthase